MENNRDSSYRLDWQTLRRDWPLWVIMTGLVVTATLVYPHLPDQVPRHWDIHGNVDAYSSRLFGAFFPPLMSIGLYFLLLFTPLLDPKRDNYSRFAQGYTAIRWGVVLLLSILYVASILFALGYPINISFIVKGLVAGLFIMIGNYMGQFRHNYFVGIKTPWTLASEEVWQRTHRMASRIWVAFGLLCLVMSFIDAVWSGVVYFVAILLMVIIPSVYSFVIFNGMPKSNQ
mgnify:FL=1